MPADGSSCCPFASNGDVGTSRFEEQFWRRLNNFTHVQNASILAGRRRLGYARSSYILWRVTDAHRIVLAATDRHRQLVTTSRDFPASSSDFDEKKIFHIAHWHHKGSKVTWESERF